MKPSVLLLLRSLTVGGAERQATQLAIGLAEAGHRVAVAVFYGGGPFEADLRAKGVQVLDLAKAGRWDTLGFLRRLTRAVRTFGPDIVYSFIDVCNVVAAVTKPWLGDARVVWGIRSAVMDLSHYDWGFRAAEWLERRLAWRADAIIANSHTGRDICLLRGLPPARLTVIPNGIDLHAFRHDAAAGAALRAHFGIPQGATLIGIVGRLDPMKDHHTFLTACAHLAATRPDARFMVVGDGPLEVELRHAATALALPVVWAGRQKNMVSVYSALDLLALTSRGEGFPNVLIEAQACGVPCVTTNVGDAAGIVGSAGRVVRPGEPRAVAEALSEMLEAITAQPGCWQAKARAEADRFGRAVMIAATLALFESLLEPIRLSRDRR